MLNKTGQPLTDAEAAYMSRFTEKARTAGAIIPLTWPEDFSSDMAYSALGKLMDIAQGKRGGLDGIRTLHADYTAKLAWAGDRSFGRDTLTVVRICEFVLSFYDEGVPVTPAYEEDTPEETKALLQAAQETFGEKPMLHNTHEGYPTEEEICVTDPIARREGLRPSFQNATAARPLTPLQAACLVRIAQANAALGALMNTTVPTDLDRLSTAINELTGSIESYQAFLDFGIDPDEALTLGRRYIDAIEAVRKQTGTETALAEAERDFRSRLAVLETALGGYIRQLETMGTFHTPA